MKPPVATLQTDKLPLISATSLADFSACPRRFWFRCVQRLVSIESTDAQERGINWHKLMELAGDGSKESYEKAVDWISTQYENIPNDKTLDEWTVERNRFFAGLRAWHWHWYGNSSEETSGVAPGFAEKVFHHQVLGFPITGRIDHIEWVNGGARITEYKSTTRDITPGSEYWDKLRVAIQPCFYLWVMHLTGRDREVHAPLPEISYDLWRCPTTTQLKLSQTDTKKLLKTEAYYGIYPGILDKGEYLEIDHEKAPKIISKTKPDVFSIRETPGMYHARIWHEMTADPEKYFQRQPLTKLRSDLVAFEARLQNQLRVIRHMLRTNSWYEVFSACQSSFRCPYIGICRGCSRVTEVEQGECPSGFKRTGTPRKG